MNNVPHGKGYIYIMVAESGVAHIDESTYYKIGLSVNPLRRKEEIERGLSPFLSVKLVDMYPVADMMTAERKLHDLFEEERISEASEWFMFRPHHFEAVKNLANVMTEIIKPVRRATANLLYNPIDIEIGEANPVIKVNTQLESLILTYIYSRAKHPKIFDALKEEVIAEGFTYGSPDLLYETVPLFREWCSERLKWLSTQPQANVTRAVNTLRAYGLPKYGWFDYQESHKPTNLPEIRIGEKLTYGDD